MVCEFCLLYPVTIILDPFFIDLIIFFSIFPSAIQAKLFCWISNLYFFFPVLAEIVLLVLNSYPAVILISSETLSWGLKVTKSLASLSLLFGDCNTGLDCAKQIFCPSLLEIKVVQSLNLPTSFTSSALRLLCIISIPKTIKIFLRARI